MHLKTPRIQIGFKDPLDVDARLLFPCPYESFFAIDNGGLQIEQLQSSKRRGTKVVLIVADRSLVGVVLLSPLLASASQFSGFFSTA
jgi:hypothetical protein